MDCLRATEILSASHDGEPIEPQEYREATDHCARCESCALFNETLIRIETHLAPEAPQQLVDRIVTESAAIAAELAEARTAALTEPVADGLPEPVPLPAPRRAWSGRLVAFASAAAVLLLAVGVTSALLIGRAATDTANETASTSDVEYDEPLAATPESGGASEDSTEMRSAQAAPPYIAIDGTVWQLVGPATPQASLLTTVAAFSHSLDDTGTPEQRYAYTSSSTPEMLYVKADDGGYLEFSRVVRSLGQKAYGLMTGTAPLRYGEWPTLPSRFATPLEEDGSPTFHAVAKDDLGVDAYIPSTGQIADGFAIAPGTSPDDPAAGNPNWTWWEPLD